MLNVTEASSVGCANMSSDVPANVSCAPATQSPTWAGSMEPSEISRVGGGIILSIVILAFSAPPAAAIWRTPSLHRVSYLYVMVLSLLDCLVGAMTFFMAVAAIVLGPLLGGVPCWLCIFIEAVTNGSMNAVNVFMLALGRDRYLSLAHALSYPLLATTADVRRHVKIALGYGAVHASIFFAARAHLGCVKAVLKGCLPLNWLLKPEYRVVAIVTVLGNFFLDGGTIVYNGYVMYWAWKLKRKQVHPQSVGQDQMQVSHHMRIFFFTFKLACLFLVCSLPYKMSILLYGLGVQASVTVVRRLALIRMLYFILDGWAFCSNDELLSAVKNIFRSPRAAERPDP